MMFMQTSLDALQTSLIVTLRGNTTLMDKVVSVDDKLPSAGAEKPYVTIGDPTSTPHTTKTSFGENIVIPLHVWSDYGGKRECYQIFNLILFALKEPLNLNGSFFMLRRELVSMNVFYDPIEDGVVHGVMELRFFINN